MAESPPTDRLLVWSLATFHTGLFVICLVIVLYWNGTLGDLLHNLNTLIGLTFFVVLWCTTWWCTRRALRGITLVTPAGLLLSGELLSRGTAWGGVNGILFAVILFLGLGISSTISKGLTAVLMTIVLPAPLYALFLSIPAFFIGGMVGVLLAIADSILLAISQRLFLVCK